MATSFKSKKLITALQQLRNQSRAWPIFLTLRQERLRIRKFLVDQGGEVLGTGAFSTVVGFGRYAVKVVWTNESSGYLSFARWCMRNPLPILPKIYSVQRMGNYTLVVMETLEVDGPRALKMAKTLKKCLGWNTTRGVGRTIGRSEAHLSRSLKGIRGILYRNVNSSWDIHNGNILFRNEGGRSRMVLMDPITY